MGSRTGRGALAKRRKRRLKQKMDRKRAQKAQYEAWRDAGTNSKRASIRKSKARRGIRVDRHRKRAKVMVDLPKTGQQLTQKQFRNTMNLRTFLRSITR